MIDSDKYEQLGNLEQQLPFQMEMFTAFFNQQPEWDIAKDESPRPVETKTVTNLSTDDEFNPFLTFLKTKTDLLNPAKMSKKEAISQWAYRKKYLSKMYPILMSHFENKACNLYILVRELTSFLSASQTTIAKKVKQLEKCVDFSFKYMNIYYGIDLYKNINVDLSPIFKFITYQQLLKSQQVITKVNEAVNQLSYNLTSEGSMRLSEITAAVLKIEKVKTYFSKESALQKAEKLNQLMEKKSNVHVLTHQMPFRRAVPRRSRRSRKMPFSQTCFD